MTLTLQSTQSVQLVNHCLVYGKAKAGKTRLLVTAPNPVICSADKGLSSIRQHDLPFYEINSHADYLEFESMARAGQFNGHTVCLDDLTEICERFLVEEKPKHKNKQQAYGALQDEIMRVCRFWRDQTALTCVILCKQEKVKDESTGGFVYAPRVPGQAVGKDLPYLFGSIFHMEDYVNPADGVRTEVLRTKQNAQYEAGDRSGKLAELEYANLTSIFAKVMS